MAEPTTVSAAQPETIPQTPAPAPAPAPQPSAQATPSPSVATGGGSAPVAAAPFSLRSYMAKTLGQPDLEKTFTDDEMMAGQLAEIVRNSAVYAQKAQLADRYAPHASEFDQWLAEKQKQAEAAKAKQAGSWWQSPQYDPRWEQAIDPQTGLARPGEDPTIPGKLRAYHDFQRKMLNDLAQNPMKVIEPGLKEAIGPIIEEALKTHLGAFQSQQTANSYVSQNQNWLFTKDAQGNVNRNILSPAGQLFQTHVKYLDGIGVRDVSEQQKIAERFVEGDMMRAWMEANKDKIAALGGTPSASVPAGANRIAAASGSELVAGEYPKTVGLAERIRSEFKKNGVTDNAFKS